MQDVFLSGGTGYMGSRLASRLVEGGHRVWGLARPGSMGRLPADVIPVVGSALEADSFAHSVPRGSVYVHLVGVAHPAPWKERAFREIDLVALRASATAAKAASVSNFVYVSVAHPAPVMRAYIRVRQECEAILQQTGMRSTVLRPWYVVGPGHWWPVILKPLYAFGEGLESTREGARRLGLVTVDEMVEALRAAVERNTETGNVVWDVPAIREAGKRRNQATTGSVRNRGRTDESAA